MPYLQPDRVTTILGLQIKEKIMPKSRQVGTRTIKRSSNKITPNTLTIHNTGHINVNPKTTMSEQYARATYNGNMGDVRIHYWVCDKEAWNQIPETDESWHGGTRAANSTSISIEIIGGSKGATDNGAKLAASILHRRGWTVERLRTHNYWRGQPDKIVIGASKNCPLYILGGIGWEAFKKMVEQYLKELQEPKTEPIKDKSIHRVQIGAYRNVENANRMSTRAQKLGYTVWQFQDTDGLYKVQIGAFAKIENAKKLKAQLEKDGFDTWIVEKGLPTPPEKVVEPEPPFKVGDKVTVKSGAKNWVGKSLSSWVYKTVFDVLEVNGDRAVIGRNGHVTAAMNIKDLIKR